MHVCLCARITYTYFLVKNICHIVQLYTHIFYLAVYMHSCRTHTGMQIYLFLQLWCVRVQLVRHVHTPPSFSSPVAISVSCRASSLVAGAEWPCHMAFVPATLVPCAGRVSASAQSHLYRHIFSLPRSLARSSPVQFLERTSALQRCYTRTFQRFDFCAFE